MRTLGLALARPLLDVPIISSLLVTESTLEWTSCDQDLLRAVLRGLVGLRSRLHHRLRRQASVRGDTGGTE